MTTSKSSGKGKQGFASMDADKQKEVASKGGQTTHKGHKGEEPKAKQGELDEGELDEVDESEDTDELDESQELDELLNLLEETELTDFDPEEGTSLIDEWHEILSESDDKGLKEIGKSLAQLKKALTASKSKPEAIAEALTQLGEKTDKYADQAERGYKTKLHKLGKALSQAGKSLESAED